jgi:hypothetical protein
MIDFKVSLSHRDSISLIATAYAPLDGKTLPA